MCLKSISKAAHVLTNHFLPLQIYSPSRKDSSAQQTEESSEKIKAIRGVVTTRVAEVTSLGLTREASGTPVVSLMRLLATPLCAAVHLGWEPLQLGNKQPRPDGRQSGDYNLHSWLCG